MILPEFHASIQSATLACSVASMHVPPFLSRSWEGLFSANGAIRVYTCFPRAQGTLTAQRYFKLTT